MRRFIFIALIFALIGCGEDPDPIPEPEWDREYAPESVKLVKGTISISPGRYSDYPFSITSGLRNVSVKGEFESVSGGDLYVCLFDDLNFKNWSGGGDSRALYNSGKVIVGEIDIPLSLPDDYHLVFSNTHSVITTKKVSADVDIWSQR